MPDYQCFPIWWGDDEAQIGNIDPRDLRLSADLVAALYAWAAMFDAMLRWDDPANSAFDTPEAERVFKETGELLRARLQAELGPDVEVILRA